MRREMSSGKLKQFRSKFGVKEEKNYTFSINVDKFLAEVAELFTKLTTGEKKQAVSNILDHFRALYDEEWY